MRITGQVVLSFFPKVKAYTGKVIRRVQDGTLRHDVGRFGVVRLRGAEFVVKESHEMDDLWHVVESMSTTDLK